MATVTALQLKTLFWRYQGELWTGTATSGSTSKLADTSIVDLDSTVFPYPFKGKQIRITSTITDLRRIVEGPNAAGELEPERAFSSAVSTNTYEVWGNSINGGTPLTNLLNDVLKVARPLTQTQLTIVTDQAVYDITSYANSREDVTEVYRRDLDTTSLEPYEPIPVFWWDVYPLITTGVQALKLEIRPTLTLDATARELWMEHYKTLTAFSNDTSTVDATYQDWLAWEAILLHCVRMRRNGVDKERWSEMGQEAAVRVKDYRKQYMPMKQRRRKFSRPQYM